MQRGANAMPCVILAGGQGRRIGGAKAFVTLGQKPLWRHVADRIAPQVGALAVNAPDGVFDLPVLPDALPGLGPLSGILTAMDWAASLGAPRVVTVAVDTPFLPRDLVMRLTTVDAPVVMAETADGLQGTCALWAVQLAPDLRAALQDGLRKVTEWSTAQSAQTVRFEGTPPPFFNINTQADLAQAEAWL